MSKISFEVWGVDDGRVIYLFKIENASGAYVELTNYGATLVSVNVPERDGKIGNVILGYPSINGYLNDLCYIGSTIGRFANRIAKAKFELNGITYQLAETGGTESVTLTTQQIPIHSHVPGAANVGNSDDPLNAVWAASALAKAYAVPGAVDNLNPALIQPAGGNQPHENMMPFLVITYIISLFGVFPSPN